MPHLKIVRRDYVAIKTWATAPGSPRSRDNHMISTNRFPTEVSLLKN